MGVVEVLGCIFHTMLHGKGEKTLKMIMIFCVEIVQKNAKNFMISTVYRPPKSSNYLLPNYKELFDNFLTNVNKFFNEAIVLGDLNINFLDKNACRELKSIILLQTFHQILKSPTRITKDSTSLIDVILTSNLNTIINDNYSLESERP